MPGKIILALIFLALLHKKPPEPPDPITPVIPDPPDPITPDIPDPIPDHWNPSSAGKVEVKIEGFHRAKRRELHSKMVKRAKEMIFEEKHPFETVEEHGNWAIGIEHHFHPPGGESRPWGWHKGATVFIRD